MQMAISCLVGCASLELTPAPSFHLARLQSPARDSFPPTRPTPTELPPPSSERATSLTATLDLTLPDPESRVSPELEDSLEPEDSPPLEERPLTTLESTLAPRTTPREDPRTSPSEDSTPRLPVRSPSLLAARFVRPS